MTDRTDEWSNSLLDDCPDSLLWWFAAYCAEQRLRIDQGNGNEVSELEWAGVEAMRAFAAGEIAREELESAAESASASARESAWAWASAWARESAWASTSTRAWACAWARASASTRESAWASARASARGGQIAYLAYLREAWAACGERSAQLLREGLCPIPYEEAA